jgi:hypothetical protein
MNKIFVVLFVVLFMEMLIACDQSGSKNNPAEIVKKDTITKTKIASSNDKNINQNNNPILHAGVDTFSVRLQMNGIKDRKVIPLNIVSGKELFAVIHKNDGKDNIRINQLEMPDGTFDGPFGDSLYYKIKIAGVYKIIIGPDLMATGKLDRAFKLKVWTR